MRTNDGQVLTATTPRRLVTELHNLSWSPCDNDRAFMRETADRVMLQCGRRIRAAKADDFIADLLKLGLLIPDEEE